MATLRRNGGLGAITCWVVCFGLFAGNDYRRDVGVLIGIYAISALGLSVVFGRAGQLHLGQAGFMAIGAYTVAYTTTAWGFPFLAAIALGCAGAAVFGVVLGWIALRLRGNYLAMASLGFGAMIFTALKVESPLGGNTGIFGIPGISLFGLEISETTDEYWFVWAVAAAAYTVCWLFQRGRVGRELTALRHDELAASAIGIDVTRRKIQAFALCATLGGISGGIMSAQVGIIDPVFFQPLVSLELVLMVVIGGLGSLPGAIAGTAVVVWLIQLVPGSGDWALLGLGAVVVVLMAVAPGGLAAVLGHAHSRLIATLSTAKPVGGKLAWRRAER